MASSLTDFDLQVRYQVYRHFAELCKAPTVLDIAALLNAPETAVRASFHNLHAHHMIFLQRGTDVIRMANPFSAVPTRFNVKSGEKEWWANCAWDSLGIAAMLNIDTHIEADYVDTPGSVELQVKDGAVDGKGHVVYFALPARQWYDDLPFT